jgi:hypothetical protein
MTFTVRDEWGIACPNCGCDDRLQVQLTTMANLTPDGTEPFGDQEWDDTSFMRCASCSHSGRVTDFYVEDAQSWQPAPIRPCGQPRRLPSNRGRLDRTRPIFN